MAPENLSRLFPPPLMNRLCDLLDMDRHLVLAGFDQPGAADALAKAEILITSWGCPPIDQQVLDAAPRLRAVLHAAGTVRDLITPPCWDRGLLVSTAAAANAVPVAEYTLAAVLLSGKNAFALRDALGHGRSDPHADRTLGNYRRRIGVIGASRVGRRLLELLRPLDLLATLADPYVDPAEAAELGATLQPLDELLRGSDIVSLHAPDLPQTHRMLDRRRLALIPDGATLINTSRGALIDPGALIDELVSGRLNAVLDVTEPEPLPADSPLHRLPNVILTPHIAGSLGNELERLGNAVVEEAERLVEGRSLEQPVLHTDLDRVA
ncbi:hydroxyacid dehydrogenase [Streptacidiphilus sp. EB103A]|uniref:hydroxyacid dehydrogenase n=1 Tax=Streptacidiphilus sp. EB103A TaxID=3156275 RepID=UPI003511B642